jgi:hypothetical protein
MKIFSSLSFSVFLLPAQAARTLSKKRTVKGRNSGDDCKPEREADTKINVAKKWDFRQILKSPDIKLFDIFDT